MKIIEIILINPGQRVPAQELEGSDRDHRLHQNTQKQEIVDYIGTKKAWSKQETVDETALNDYYKHIKEINYMIENETMTETERVHLENEKEFLLEETRKATGLGGNPRKLGSTPTDKATDRVRKAIDAALKAIAQGSMPNLATHLRESIQREGSSFSYQPKRPAPTWLTTVR